MQAGKALRAAQLSPARRAVDERDGVRRAYIGAAAAADAGGKRVEILGRARLPVLFGDLGKQDAQGVASLGVHAFARFDAQGRAMGLDFRMG